MAGEWASKLQRYTSVQQKRVAPNPKRSDSPDVAVRTEGEAVLKALVPAVRSGALRLAGSRKLSPTTRSVSEPQASWCAAA